MNSPLYKRLFTPQVCQSCRGKAALRMPLWQSFTSTAHRRAGGAGVRSDSPLSTPDSSEARQRQDEAAPYPSIWRPSVLNDSPFPSYDAPQALTRSPTNTRMSSLSNDRGRISERNPKDFTRSLQQSVISRDPFVLNIYCHRHNTHITLDGPFPPKSQLQGQFDKRKMISMSCGNIGFRKAQRSTYDAAFQLAAYVMGQITERNILPLIDEKSLEVRFRGFGKGRNAVEAALLGNEGRRLRKHIVRISDTTRLKFGGTRSPNPRRLG